MLGWDPAHAIIWAEGHPGDEGRLAKASDLGAPYERLRSRMRDEGLVLRTEAAVSRLDVAATLEFAHAEEGRAILSSVGLLHVPRCKPEVHGHPAETVYFKAIKGQRKYCRVYDFGLSRQLGERGRWLRLEDQRRFPLPSRPRVSDLTALLLRTVFARRFSQLCVAAKGVLVAAPGVIARELRARVKEGELHVREAERMAGFIMLESAGGELHTRRTQYRRHKELAEHGLVTNLDALDAESLDLGLILRSALEAALGGFDD